MSVRNTSFSAFSRAARHRGGGRVRVHVQPTALVVHGQRRDHRHHVRVGEVGDQSRIHFHHMTDTAQVNRSGRSAARKEQLAAEQALESVGVQADGPAAELRECLRMMPAVDLVLQDLFTTTASVASSVTRRPCALTSA